MESQFLNILIDRVKDNPPSLLIPESWEERMLQAAEQVCKLHVAKPLLLGYREEVEATAQKAGVDLTGMEIIEPTPELQQQVKEKFMKISSFLTEKSLDRKLKDNKYLGAGMVRIGMADCMASGFTCPTGEMIMIGQQMLGLKEGTDHVSSFCVLEDPNFHGSEGNLLCITDCVVYAEPDSAGLADIAINAADAMHAMLGWEPRVGMLSFSTAGSGDGDTVDKVIEAVKIANEKRPDLHIEGEFQLDAAIDPVVAAKKVPEGSYVAGRANIIVFPDVNAGNIGVKLINYFGHMPVHGAIVCGFNIPMLELSRSAPLEQLVGAMIMLAATIRGEKA